MCKRILQRFRLMIALLICAITAIEAYGQSGQVDFSTLYSVQEILNANRQPVTDSMFADTLAAGDTVTSRSLSLWNLKKGQPRFWRAAIKLDTLAGHPAPAFSAKFMVQVDGYWFDNPESTNLFADSISEPCSLFYNLRIGGGDSVKYWYWAVDSCIVRHWQWAIH